VLGLVEVFGGVPILGGIAAAHVAADLTEAQVDPRVAHLQTFLTPLRPWFGIFDLVKV
jgi:hypothetical protein